MMFISKYTNTTVLEKCNLQYILKTPNNLVTSQNFGIQIFHLNLTMSTESV